MAEIPKKMKEFNLVALKIFEHLYEAFPEPIDVKSDSFNLEIISDDSTAEEDGFNERVIAESTLKWLATEGFLRYETSSFGGVFHNVQLTLKGLTILGSVPASLSQNEVPEPMIKKIKSALAKGTNKAAEESVKSVLYEVLKIAYHTSVAAFSSGIITL